MTDDRAMEVWNAAKVAYHSTTSPFPTGASEAAAAIISQALAAERKARDAEICAWLRGMDDMAPFAQFLASRCEMPDWEPAWIFPHFADAIERGEV